MSKLEKIKNFDPNNLASAESNIYGLPFTESESEIIILPLPWDVTVSYNDNGNAINISRDTLTYSNVAANGDNTKTAFLASVGRAADDLLVIVNGLIILSNTTYI